MESRAAIRAHSEAHPSKHIYQAITIAAAFLTVTSQVIRHGNACHAYMDIEFSAAINAGLDGDAMTRASRAPLPLLLHAQVV
jgi:hypothetical protein